jgi:hypothetical protein
MTIRKGEGWGVRISTPTSIRRAHSDADLSQCSRTDFVSLTDGDIHRTLGSPRPIQKEAECTLLPIDALQIRVGRSDGSEQHVIAASRVEIGSLLSPIRRRRFVCVSNGGIVNGRNLAPRAHPNDGRLDVMTIEATMTFRHRLTARKKAVTGTHLPHPRISVRQDDAFSFQKISTGERLSIDGVAIKDWTDVSISILPDYWQVVV